MAIVEQEGHDALTLRAVAKELGYVPAALYRYFPSKDALVAALQRRAIASLGGELAEPVARAAREPLAALLEIADVYLGFPRKDPRSFALIATLLGDQESRKTAPVLMTILSAVSEVFASAARRGKLSEGDALTRTLGFWGALHGVAALEKTRGIAPELPTARAVGLASAAALLVGFGADRAELERELSARLTIKERSQKAVRVA